ncbi:FAD-dependent oxidoreductase [Vitiosangium sp. GDMCC 1.1324]|uniref:FAD-dependent oxidoreductase n=1 Tax=Vitiosangium sp. (strain GDMCC 1.1324) TaxID=2138576 RepID=UPI0018EE6F4D|nr:FAD-dependent oxidoreductase [Vitiosangium sp. GDMCC 1.1324]
MGQEADVIVVGGGLAGLVTATELADAGKRVTVLDQEGEQSLGGQAFWSFGGLFLVDSRRGAPGQACSRPSCGGRRPCGRRGRSRSWFVLNQ